MNIEEIKELSSQTKKDGRRLFGVAETIYLISIVSNWTIGIFGFTIALYALARAPFYGAFICIAIIFFTILVCVINYMISVLLTHYAKVLVNTSFASLAMVEKMYDEE